MSILDTAGLVWPHAALGHSWHGDTQLCWGHSALLRLPQPQHSSGQRWHPALLALPRILQPVWEASGSVHKYPQPLPTHRGRHWQLLPQQRGLCRSILGSPSWQEGNKAAEPPPRPLLGQKCLQDPQPFAFFIYSFFASLPLQHNKLIILKAFFDPCHVWPHPP